MNKPKTPQKENLNEVSGRDLFQTPNYATEILVPFLENLAIESFKRQPVIPARRFRIWECAAGKGKIFKYLEYCGFDIRGTDLQGYEEGYAYPLNFLTETPTFYFDCIVTNPPFSLKRKFYLKCRKYGVPFAILIPADYSGWIIRAMQDGAEKIIPTRRIDYITPNILENVCQGESWKKASDIAKEVWKKRQSFPKQLWNYDFMYKNIDECPVELLGEYSSSYYHSMWLTWGFNIGKSETFVELTNEMKRNI